MSLYQRALGDSFENLAPVLQEFHRGTQGHIAQGHLSVKHGRGWFQQALAVILRLPPTGENVPVTLQVECHGDRERWVRRIGAQSLVTWQWLNQGSLMESIGPLRFRFQLKAVADAMDFISQKCWLLGVPLPRFLAPLVTATARGTVEGWELSVSLVLPGIGELLSYEGKLTPA